MIALPLKSPQEVIYGYFQFVIKQLLYIAAKFILIQIESIFYTNYRDIIRKDG